MFGTMPAHLNEISPQEARATFPGFTYQFGNFLAAGNATLQVTLAAHLHGDYGIGMALVAGAGAVLLALLAALGPEAKEIRMIMQTKLQLPERMDPADHSNVGPGA